MDTQNVDYLNELLEQDVELKEVGLPRRDRGLFSSCAHWPENQGSSHGPRQEGAQYGRDSEQDPLYSI